MFFDLAIGVSTIGFGKVAELMEEKRKASGLSRPGAATEGGGVGEPFKVMFEVEDLHLLFIFWSGKGCDVNCTSVSLLILG
jgi:hypothetical protein